MAPRHWADSSSGSSLHTDNGVIVEQQARAGRDWQLVSENPEKQAWPTLPWPAGAVTIGEVKRAGRTL